MFCVAFLPDCIYIYILCISIINVLVRFLQKIEKLQDSLQFLEADDEDPSDAVPVKKATHTVFVDSEEKGIVQGAFPHLACPASCTCILVSDICVCFYIFSRKI